MSPVWPATGKNVLETEPLAKVLRYHHATVGVTDVGISKEFYVKLGFDATTDNDKIVVHPNGMAIHFITAEPTADNQNLLMDFPTSKAPGHTHLSFGVPNVPEVKKFLEHKQGMAITGERVMGGVLRAVFVRDPNRTTLEFERNVGEMDELKDEFTASSMIGDTCRPMDHVGTRVNDPEGCFAWYAKTLGFTKEVMHYTLNPDPLKNGRPFISRTEDETAGIDINLIPNGNIHGDVGYNQLIQQGKIYPGILYVGYTVKNLDACRKNFEKAGVEFWEESEVSGLGLKEEEHVYNVEAPSIFLRDPHGSLFRLVEETR